MDTIVSENAHFERLFADRGEVYERVSEKTAREKLSGWLRNIDEMLEIMRQGQQLRTPFAFYRYAANDQNCKCGQAFQL